MHIFFRPMNAGDVRGVMQVDRLSFKIGVRGRQDSYEQFISDPRVIGIVALQLVKGKKDRVVGHLVASIDRAVASAYAWAIAVHPDYRRQLIATRLLMKSLRLLKREGIKTLSLHVRAGNVPAISLYKKHGFTVLQTLPGLYPAPHREDGLLMERKL